MTAQDLLVKIRIKKKKPLHKFKYPPIYLLHGFKFYYAKTISLLYLQYRVILYYSTEYGRSTNFNYNTNYPLINTVRA